MPRRALRIGLIAIAVLFVLVIGAGAVFLFSFDPNSLKPRIVAAVKQATGRDLTLNGKIGLQFSLQPTVEVTDVALSNPPGFSRPQMATLQRLDLQLAVLPLLHRRIEINRLVLVHPDVSLETDAQGRSNWEFRPEAAAAPTPPAPPPAGQPPAREAAAPSTISIASVRIDDGTLIWHDARTRATTTLGVKRLEAKAESADAPMHLNLDASYNGAGFGLVGDVGPLARLQDPTSTVPWPVKLTMTAGGAKLVADGALTHPLQGRGYTLALQGAVPDLAALAAFAPAAKLPPLHDVRFDVKVADSGGAVPDVSALTLHVGATDLGAYAGGMRLDKLDVTAPRSDQPMQAVLAGKLADAPMTLAAALGAPAALLPGRQGGPFPVDIKAQLAGASIAVKGAIARPDTLSGVDLGITAEVPDLAALSPLVHHSLPALKSVAFQGRLTDASGGFAHGATLRDIKLTTPDGDLSGEASVAAGNPPSLTAKLHAGRIDADALRAAAGRPVTNAPAAGAPTPAEAVKPGKGGRLISDTPLPFELLRLANADLTLTVSELKTSGADYRAIELHAVLRDGKLRLDPLVADLPEGHVDVKLSADATQPAPPVTLTMQAPGLAVAPLLAAAGLPAYANGKLEVRADLRGAGASPHAIAAGLDGTFGLAMQGGTVDTRLLGSILGPVLEKANLLGALGNGGSNELRCFAVHAVAQHGVATLRPLILSTGIMTMDGDGSVNLGAETLDLRVRPQGRVGGTGLVVPLKVTGAINAPAVAVDAAGAAEANVGTVAGALLSTNKNQDLLGGALGGALGGVLGGGKPAAGAPADGCAAALAMARGQTAPAATAAASPAPAAPSAPAAPTQPKPPNAGTMLRQLFR